VLGADTRSTSGTTVRCLRTCWLECVLMDCVWSQVADKNCEKIHYIAPNIYCCGAGTAADTENTTALVSSQLELLRLVSGRHRV